MVYATIESTSCALTWRPLPGPTLTSTYHVFYSRPTRTMDVPGIHTGHIDLAAMQRLIPSTAFDFYVCGPSAMMDSITRDFEAWDVPADRVHAEAFGPATIKQALHGPA